MAVPKPSESLAQLRTHYKTRTPRLARVAKTEHFRAVARCEAFSMVRVLVLNFQFFRIPVSHTLLSLAGAYCHWLFSLRYRLQSEGCRVRYRLNGEHDAWGIWMRSITPRLPRSHIGETERIAPKRLAADINIHHS